MNALNWKAYRDGNRIIIGASEWQAGISATDGIAVCDADVSKADLAKFLRRARVTPETRCQELRRTFWTNERFEEACDDGSFGGEW